MDNILVVIAVIIGLPICFILKTWFNQWLYTEGPLSQYKNPTKEKDIENLQKLRDRGVITEEQYLSAIEDIEGKNDGDTQ